MSRRSGFGLASCLGVFVAAGTAAAPRGSVRSKPPLGIHESVEVTGRPIESAWIPVIARDADGIGIPDLALEDLRIERRVDGEWRTLEPVSGTLALRRSSMPVALTLVIDVSSSVTGSLQLSVRLSRAILRELRDEDRLRVITFADEVRATRFIPVGDLRVQALLDLLERDAVSKRELPGLPECLEPRRPTDRVDVRILRLDPARRGELATWIAQRAASCSDADLATLMERAGDEWISNAIGHAGGGTFDGPAMHEALDGMLIGDGDSFLPLYDANLGLVLMGDCLGYCGAFDPGLAELERLLCLQRWTLSVGLPCRYRGDGERGISLMDGEEQTARSVVESARCVHELRFDVEGAIGPLRVRPASPRAVDWRFLKPPDTLPPRDVFVALVAASREEAHASGTPLSRCLAERLATASPAVRDALLRLAPAIDAPP